MKRVLSALLLSTSLVVQSALPGADASTYALPSLALSYSEQEPNNTPEDNERYSLAGGENFVFTGAVSGKGFMEDLVDYYPFQVTKTGYLSVVLQETATANLLQMDIFDEYGNEIDDDNPNHLYEIHNVRLEQGRQYFVRVSVREGMIGSGFHYRMQVGFQAQAAPVDAFEPNNTRESAAATTLGASSSGKLEGVIGSADDQDWYRFEAAETGYFKLNLHNIPEGREYDFKLYNAEGVLIASTENRPGKIMHNVHGSAGQTFYVQVYSSNGFDLNDTYQLERIFTSSYDALSGDFHEWNNNLQTASVTNLGQTRSDVAEGTIHASNDEDWYAVRLAQSGNFQAQLLYRPSENYHIALYEADGDPLYSTEYFEEHEPKQLPLHYGNQGELFYVKVFASGGDYEPHDSYEFEVAQLDGDVYEPNNTKETYTSTKLGQTNGAYVNATLHNQQDVDWYLLSPYKTGYFTIDMNKMPLAGYAMKLYDESMQEVGTAKLVNGKPQVADVFGKKGQPFYLKVYSTAIGSVSPNPYEVTMYLGSSGLSENETESNDSFETANLLKDGVDKLGALSSSTDRDYYKFKTNGAGKVHFALEGPADRDYNLVVYDANKTLYKESRVPGNQADYVLDVPVNSNEIYALVYPASGSQTGAQAIYRLKAFYKAVAADAYENNDTTDRATEASVSATGTPRTFVGTIHAGTDMDYYKIVNTNLPYDLQIDLTNIPAGSNYDVKVLNQAGVVVASSEKAANQNESFSVIVPKNAIYYIGVYTQNNSYNAEQPYQLTLKKNGDVPIIIVPGFGGTALYGRDTDDGKVKNVWMNFNVSYTAELMLQNFFGEKEEYIGIHFKDKDAGLWDITDVAPESPMAGQDIYFQDMIADLKAEGYVAGQTLFGLPYYFIRDNTEHTEALKRRTDLAIERSGSSKVMLISHSNGGLIIKEAVQDSNYASKVGKWVALGTPWLGAPKALKAWIDGFDLDIPILANDLGRELAMHSPTAYGLIPSPSYHHLHGPVLTYYQKMSETRNDHYPVVIDDYFKMVDFLSNVNDGRNWDYLDFREDLMDQAWKKHATMYDLAQTNIPLYIISGEGEPTVGSYRYMKPVNDVSELANNGSVVFPEYISGDGTVPVLSSQGRPNFPVGTKNTVVYGVGGVEHTPLVIDPRNRLMVKQLLIYGNENPVADLRVVYKNRTGAASNTIGKTTPIASPEGITATVYSIPLTGQASTITLTLKNGEKTSIQMYANKTYFIEEKGAEVTVNNVGNALWITTPVDSGTVVSWTGADVTGITVYDLQNSEYMTSYDVQAATAYKTFTVSNSVAQPNKLKGVSVQEKPLIEEDGSGLPEEYESVDEESGLGLPGSFESIGGETGSGLPQAYE
ncbi:lipase/acyltransferase domain-containing protein [Paenibacillus soyae]|uniref:Uncharacterized protein n=1 Tax=Paenibacillus soyae TaxID=2969249 RepID=A0A9X2MSC0_9BACL|nr:hypothetical protein [Paenibacillus soyae]MCR2805991.1 hypothetical protein [Paenibacillus soyae]